MAPSEDTERGSQPAPRESPGDIDQRALSELIVLAADEDPTQASVRAEAPGALSAAAGSMLAWLASMIQARHVVAVGMHGGPLGLWLLRGMGGGGILTSISPASGDHSRAREVFSQAHVTDRVRAISGRAADVLPRLSDGAYDLLVWSAGIERAHETRDHATRLLRVGGALAVLDVARDTDPDVRGRRMLVRDLVEDPRWAVTVLPVDGGMALARRL